MARQTRHYYRNGINELCHPPPFVRLSLSKVFFSWESGNDELYWSEDALSAATLLYFIEQLGAPEQLVVAAVIMAQPVEPPPKLTPTLGS